ncbi:MAG: hypothetical protein KA792_04425 [Bacteroidales bacterium]|nr:hypothetical protein [Bacteroidales bacterium]
MEKECCPKFQPADWDGKLVEWSEKKFIKASVCTAFYMPLNFGSVMRKIDKKIKAADTKVSDYLCLSDHTSKWNMDIYLAVDKEIKDADNTTLSGKFLCKVYEGPFKDTGKWCEDFKKYAAENNHIIKKWYMWYTSCPKCAKKYGKNYVVIVGEI